MQASPTWEARFRLITTIGTLAICKVLPLECVKAFFGQLRTKQMPFSVLEENMLMTSVASPAVSSQLISEVLPLTVWVLEDSSCDSDIARQSASVTLRVAWRHSLCRGNCNTQNPVPRENNSRCQCGILKEVFCLMRSTNAPTLNIKSTLPLPDGMHLLFFKIYF